MDFHDFSELGRAPSCSSAKALGWHPTAQSSRAIEQLTVIPASCVFDNPFADEDLDQFCDDFGLPLPPQVRDACLALASAPSRRGLRRAARRSVSHHSDILELFSPERVCLVGREKGLRPSIPVV